MEIAAQIAMNIVIAGAIYSLGALGFNLIYSTSRFFDLGYGAVAVAGGYGVLYFYHIRELNLAVSIALGLLVAGTLGFCIEKLVYRPLRAHKASRTVLLIASLGVLTMIQALLAILFSNQFQPLSRDVASERVFTVFGGVITGTQLGILAATLCIMAVLAYVIGKTRFGKAVRAISDDEEVASVVGINTERVIGIVFFVGALIGGAAGIAKGFDTGLQPTMSMYLLLEAGIASIIGGVGSVYGSVLGGFLLAFVENIGAWQFGGEWKLAFSFAALILFLLLRPQGILTK